MFYDLSIPYSLPQTEQLRASAELLIHLGWDVLAFNVITSSKLSPKNKIKVETFKDISSLNTEASSKSILQLSRLTCVVDDAGQSHSLNPSNSLLTSYDILAVRPTSEKAFTAACTTLEVDIISIDMSMRIPWYFKHTLTKTAIKRGIVFEIAYAAGIRDATARRYLISNAQNLIRVTKGKGIIVSSEAIKAIELRGPNDIVNLAATLFGMSTDDARRAISDNARHVLYHAATRTRTARGVTSVSESAIVSTTSDVPANAEEGVDALRTATFLDAPDWAKSANDNTTGNAQKRALPTSQSPNPKSKRQKKKKN